MLRPRLIAKSIFLSSVLLCRVAAGQTSTSQTVTIPGDSGVVTVKTRWYRYVYMPPMPSMSATQATATMGMPTGGGSAGGSFGISRRGFMYEATLKNGSGRDIKAIHWDHVFLDPTDGSEMRRFHFTEEMRSIGKGKTTTLARMSGLPPSQSIDVARLEKDSGPQYAERIDVRCVLYKGDVYWQAVGSTAAECARVRRKLKVKRTK